MTTIKPLNLDIQLRLNAATQINTFKLLVEELIYNALDAEASSLAIRINVEENYLQVVDNGIGILKNDMIFLGLKNYTSKNIGDRNLVKRSYGFKGQSLANIIQVTKTVKITSRSKFSDETWCKIFDSGKENNIKLTNTRPSKGTTVEIIGFLYNLTIQRKIVNPLSEIENIKRLLEQLSLVENNISISLRDDLKNEIMFQLHKCRDIYQTFLNVFSYKKCEILELHVEKKSYKVVAYIGKKISTTKEHNWIYLNGRLLGHCILHKIIHDSLKQLFCLKNNKQIVKTKRQNDQDDNILITKNIPFFFIFITCPYVDYDITTTNKQLEVEFNNWNQITKIIEKLIKFYASDKNIVKTELKVYKSNDYYKNKGDMREQVKEIVQRILASNSKKMGISQMQNGVKGKVLKRKKKKKLKDISVNKLLTNKRKHSDDENKENNFEIPKYSIPVKDLEPEASPMLHNKIICKPGPIKNEGDARLANLYENKIANQNEVFHRIQDNHKSKKHVKNKKEKNDNIILPSKNNILKSFEQVTDTLKQRCHVISGEVDTILNKHTNSRPHLMVNHKILQTTTFECNRQAFVDKSLEDVDSICRKFTKHELQPKNYELKFHTNNQVHVLQRDKKNNLYMSSYDLLDTILTQNNENRICTQHNSVNNDFIKETLPELTYQSHKRYNIDFTITTTRQGNVIGNNFITRKSRENVESSTVFKNKRRLFKSKKSKTCDNSSWYCNIQESSYTIEYFNSNNNQENDINYQNNHNLSMNTHGVITNTYTIKSARYSNENRHSFGDDFEILNDEVNKTYTIVNQSGQCQESAYFEPSNVNLNKTYNFVDRIEQSQDFNRADINLHDNSLPECNNENSVDLISQHTGDYSNDIVCAEDCVSNQIYQHEDQDDLANDNYSSTKNIVEIDSVTNDSSSKSNMNITQCHKVIDPVTACETILDSSSGSAIGINPVLAVQEHNFRDSLFNSNENINQNVVSVAKANVDNTFLSNEDIIIEQMEQELNEIEQQVNTLGSDFKDCSHDIGNKLITEDNNKNIDRFKTVEKEGKSVTIHKTTGMCITIDNNSYGGDEPFQINFDVGNRPRFIPKGMYPIFKNCNTKNVCDYTMEKEYFNDGVYSEFVKTVQTNTDIFEPCIQNLHDAASKEISKVNTRIKKDHSSLSFNGQDLANVKVLGQVDRKFIAAKINRNGSESGKPYEYLVLFDQHAVHERIRLESNMAEYISNYQWKSIDLDEFNLSFKPDEVMYLHNYKDKFNQFGLKWNILSEKEISVFGIPEALLGKHVRQVDIIMTAVKSLILEEITTIRAQKGSISLYPKSIMDLVFSEACRYAIKFGDRLSKTECVDLLNDLSKCKTPFQCAHGRPVMAVLMELESKDAVYKSDLSKLKKFTNKK